MIKLYEIEKYGLDTGFVNRCINSYSNREICVAVTGEFSSGKTTFVNALLNKKDFLPSGDTECTPVYVDISKGSENTLTVLKNDGSLIPLGFTAENIEKYTRFSEDYPEDIAALDIKLSDFPLNNRIHIIDCPGTNTIFKQHELITEQVIKKCDVVVYVINKVVSESSLKLIEDMYKRNNDMIFVLTHIDDTPGYEYMSKEEIDRFVNEAENVISARLGVKREAVSVFPVGSLRAYTDKSFISAVSNHLDCITEFADGDVIKKKASDKIIRHIDEVKASKEAELSLYMTAAEQEAEELEKEIIKTKDILSKSEGTLKRDDEALKRQISEKSEIVIGKLKRISDKYSSAICNKINISDDINPEHILSIINAETDKYENSVADYINSVIMSMADERYAEANEELSKLAQTLELPVLSAVELKVPDFSDKEGVKSAEVEEYERMIRDCELEIQELSIMEEDDLIRAQKMKETLEEKKAMLSVLKQKKDELGAYIPVYDDVHVDGGGAAGAKVGRIIGEIADAVLVFVAPAAGAKGGVGAAKKGADVLKAADKVKDAAKISEYALKTVSAANKGRQIINGKLLEQQSGGGTGSGAIGAISKILDLVSLGYWGEKIGSAIGEAIRPTIDERVENEEVRKQYFAEKNQIDADIKLISDEINDAKAEINNTDSITEKARIKARIASKEKALQERLEAQKAYENKLCEKENIADTKIVYCNTVKQKFADFTEEYTEVAGRVLENAGLHLSEAVNNAMSAKISEAEDKLNSLLVKKDDCNNEIIRLTELVKIYDVIKLSVDEWLDISVKEGAVL